MKVSARTRANRKNARRSTGPKSVAGKQASGRNALRHCLAVSIKHDVAAAPEVERLAHTIAGEGSDDLNLDAARRIAEAQIDLIRVRRIQLDLIQNRKARAISLTAREMTATIRVVERKYRIDNRRYFKRLDAAQTDETERAALDRDLEASWTDVLKILSELLFQKTAASALKFDEPMAELVTELARIDRYERRALSRRKRAIHAYEEIFCCRTLVGVD